MFPINSDEAEEAHRRARVVREGKNADRDKRFEQKLPVSTEKKQRNPIALDETVVKANKKRYYVYSAVDVERNELILMRVYTTRNWLVTGSFVREVLNYCENGPRFVIDKAPWLKRALESLNLGAQGFREKKLG